MDDPFFDNSQAVREGWSIFDCSGSDNGRWQLQKCDDSDKCSTDLVAWDHVRTAADAGSEYHASALKFLEQHNPDEFRLIRERRGEIA
jgi:hypothetical protein